MSRDMSRDKSLSARDIDIQPATIDISDEDTGKLEKTPSHSLPAVTLAGAGSGRPGGQVMGGATRPADGGGGDGGTTDGVDAFVDMDDIAMHVDRDPNRWHDTVRVSASPGTSWCMLFRYATHRHLHIRSSPVYRDDYLA